MSDLDRQIEQLRRCEYIKEAEVKALCAKAREILVEESNVQRVDAPVTVRASPPSASTRWPRRKLERAHLSKFPRYSTWRLARECVWRSRGTYICVCVDGPWKLQSANNAHAALASCAPSRPRLPTRACTNQFLLTALLLTRPTPLQICGDIHGQFYDLVELSAKYRHPLTKKYLRLLAASNDEDASQLAISYLQKYNEKS